MAKRAKTREYSFEHCKQRAKERYDFELTIHHWDVMNAYMHARWYRLDLLERDKLPEDDQLVYPVNVAGVEFLCSYDHERDCVTTLLPHVAMVKNVRGKVQIKEGNKVIGEQG